MLIEQLVVGGRLVIPIGDAGPAMAESLLPAPETGVNEETLADVTFVPMLGGKG